MRYVVTRSGSTAANLQIINFIHSQGFVQILFGYILNKTSPICKLPAYFPLTSITLSLFPLLVMI